MIHSTAVKVIPNDCSSCQSVPTAHMSSHVSPSGHHVAAEMSARPSSCVSPQVQPLQLEMMDPFNYSAVAGPSQAKEDWSWKMEEDFPTSAAGVCSLPTMQQQCEGGASVDTPPQNTFTAPMLCTLTTGGLVWLRNPFQTQCDSFHPAPAQMKDNWTVNKDVLGTHRQFHQQQQEDLSGTVEPPTPPVPSDGAVAKAGKSRKRCHCTKSQCLKLYCSCFASGLLCNNCSCSNCFNNQEHQQRHLMAIQLCQKRNPNAFRPKIVQGSSKEVKGWHATGCKCKRCFCLKEYCECFQAHISCSPSCQCVGCMNKF